MHAMVAVVRSLRQRTDLSTGSRGHRFGCRMLQRGVRTATSVSPYVVFVSVHVMSARSQSGGVWAPCRSICGLGAGCFWFVCFGMAPGAVHGIAPGV